MILLSVIGDSQQSSRKCPSCSEPVPDQFGFCPICGHKFGRFRKKRAIVVALVTGIVILAVISIVIYKRRGEVSGPSAQADPFPGLSAPVLGTKLEAFMAKAGSLVIKGYTELGSIRTKSGVTTVVVVELRDARSPELRAFGLQISVTPSGMFSSSTSSSVDYDEIDSLVEGIDYLKSLDREHATKLQQFEAQYTTKGKLGFGVHENEKRERNAAISSGLLATSAQLLSIEDLSKLRGLVIDGKVLLDSIK